MVATGTPAAQMRRALCFASTDEALHVAFAEIIRRLNAAGSGKYEEALFISTIFHKAFVEVNKEGTEEADLPPACGFLYQHPPVF